MIKKPFKLIYGTNIWSHHQAPVATELARLLGEDQFRMALFEPVHQERVSLGWGDEKLCPWRIGPPADKLEKDALFRTCLDADVMIFGACPNEILRERAARGKLTLVSSERMLKKKHHRLRMLNPRYARGIRRFRTMVDFPQVHALAIGAHAAEDLRIIGAFGSRIWKWGYFVEVNPESPVPRPDRPLQLLWVGRMLSWKRVDLILKAIAELKGPVRLGLCRIVGEGPEKPKLLKLAQSLGLGEDRVCFLPPVKATEVRRLMRESDVYVLASDRGEGWGAVTGEAMSEGCIAVANEQAGSAKELITDNETGLLFQDGNHHHLAARLAHLAQNHDFRLQLSRRAWERMQTTWHPRTAAERLVALCEGLLAGSPPSFSDGPCARILRPERTP